MTKETSGAAAEDSLPAGNAGRGLTRPAVLIGGTSLLGAAWILYTWISGDHVDLVGRLNGYFLLVTVFLATIGAGAFVWRYLEVGFSMRNGDAASSESARVAELQAAVTELPTRPPPTTTAASVTPTTTATTSVPVATEPEERQFAAWSLDIRKRLGGEVLRLGRRGTVNLVIGLVLAVAGVVVLLYVANSLRDELLAFQPVSAGALSTWPVFVTLQLMRLSLVVFLEAFALFFLRLYRSNIEDIKYYQNELTNLEVWFAALAAAQQTGNGKTIASILNRLSQIERNFVLKRGETTVELEKSRQEVLQLRDLVSLAGVWPGAQGRQGKPSNGGGVRRQNGKQGSEGAEGS